VHAALRSVRAWSQKTIGACWEALPLRRRTRRANSQLQRLHRGSLTCRIGVLPIRSKRDPALPCLPASSAHSNVAERVLRTADFPRSLQPEQPQKQFYEVFQRVVPQELTPLRAHYSPTPRLHASQGNKSYEAGVGSSQKVRDPAQGRVPRKLHTATYPLVTTGGGALPLPTYVPQPATLRRASTAAIAKASFFMGSPP